MDAWIVSHEPTGQVRRALREAGLRLSRARPDVVFSLGGDGTLLEAEAAFPGVPKVPLRDRGVFSPAPCYHPRQAARIAQLIAAGRYRVREWGKVEAAAAGRRLLALNEIQVRSQNPSRALRFTLTVDGKASTVIGDGIVAATAFGSTGYYRSIGNRPFSRGVRVGFNNVYPRRPPQAFARCRLRIERELAWVFADTATRVALRPGQQVTIRPSKEKARFVIFQGVRR
ncbi:MAG: NAD(+)/NADH kinase [Candidatus Aenigmarchaeota archaeon]|nr:NAD(+)/NADH kinase [Candidatus Aenigmarchaeota archaeon]